MPDRLDPFAAHHDLREVRLGFLCRVFLDDGVELLPFVIASAIPRQQFFDFAWRALFGRLLERGDDVANRRRGVERHRSLRRRDAQSDSAEVVLVVAVERQRHRDRRAAFEANWLLELEPRRMILAELRIDRPASFWIAINRQLHRQARILIERRNGIE